MRILGSVRAQAARSGSRLEGLKGRKGLVRGRLRGGLLRGELLECKRRLGPEMVLIPAATTRVRPRRPGGPRRLDAPPRRLGGYRILCPVRPRLVGAVARERAVKGEAAW